MVGTEQWWARRTRLCFRNTTFSRQSEAGSVFFFLTKIYFDKIYKRASHQSHCFLNTDYIRIYIYCNLELRKNRKNKPNTKKLRCQGFFKRAQHCSFIIELHEWLCNYYLSGEAAARNRQYEKPAIDC